MPGPQKERELSSPGVATIEIFDGAARGASDPFAQPLIATQLPDQRDRLLAGVEQEALTPCAM